MSAWMYSRCTDLGLISAWLYSYCTDLGLISAWLYSYCTGLGLMSAWLYSYCVVMFCCVLFLTQPGYSPDVFDDLGSTAVDSLPPVEMPDIPDFTD